MSDRYIVLSGPGTHIVWDKQEQVHLGTSESETEAHMVAHELNHPEPSHEEREDVLISALTGNAVFSTEAAQEALSVYVKAMQAKAWERGREETRDDIDWRDEVIDDRTNPYTGEMGGRG